MRRDEKRIAVSTFDPVDVLWNVARKHGIEDIALALSKSQQLVYAKLKESVDGKTPSLREAVTITDRTRDTSLVLAWAQHLGGVFIQLPEAMADEDDVLDDLIELSEALGKLATEFREARKDGIVDAKEFERMKMAATGIHVKLGELIADIASQVTEVPKQPLRVA